MSNPKQQDLILVESLLLDPLWPHLPAAVTDLARDETIAAGNLKAFQVLSEPRLTIYVSGVPFAKRDAIAAAVKKHLLGVTAGEIEVSRLSARNLIAGASHGTDTEYQLVVRTNVAQGGGPELERWYDEEHLGRLAAVPGCALAQRLISQDGLPLYYACYDITAPSVVETRTWLSVRETEWSGRVRPTFRDTRRFLSRRIALDVTQ